MFSVLNKFVQYDKEKHSYNFLKKVQDLNKIETGSCAWTLFPGLSFLGQENPREFPVVASTLNENNEKQESHLLWEVVAQLFKRMEEF